MKLAVVASHPVQYYAPLYRELAQADLDLTVFYCHRDSQEDQAHAGFEHGFSWDVDLLSGYPHCFLENRARQPGLGRFAGVDTPGIGDALAHGRFDAVLVMGWYLKAFVQALFAARRLGQPVLVRGDSQLGTPRSALKKWVKWLCYPPFLQLFSAALVVGRRNREYWAHYSYPARRMFDSPHCVDTTWFAHRATPQVGAALRSRMGIAPEAPVALFAGKLVSFKRPQDLLQGAAQARAAGCPVQVLIAGSGPLEAELRATAADLHVPMHMLGFCNQSEMPFAYAAADVLVLPSDGRETWGLVANEALACGTPVLISDAAGCAGDLVAQSRAGAARSYSLGDVAALGRSLVSVFASPVPSEDIAAVSAAHSVQAAARGIVEAVHSVAKPMRPSAGG